MIALCIVFLGILLCYIIAWVLAMQLITQTAKEKGYSNLSGKLWFIGLFGLIFTPAIIVSALPDQIVQKGIIEGSDSTNVDDELPSI